MVLLKSMLDAIAISIAFVFVTGILGRSTGGAIMPVGFVAIVLTFFLELLGIRL